LNVNRAVGIPAGFLGPPDGEQVGELAGVEQLNAAQLHQLGVLVVLL
jgi:hypothetical protein